MSPEVSDVSTQWLNYFWKLIEIGVIVVSGCILIKVSGFGVMARLLLQRLGGGRHGPWFPLVTITAASLLALVFVGQGGTSLIDNKSKPNRDLYLMQCRRNCQTRGYLINEN